MQSELSQIVIVGNATLTIEGSILAQILIYAKGRGGFTPLSANIQQADPLMLRANTYGGDNLVELTFHWSVNSMIHPNYFNVVRLMTPASWVPEYPGDARYSKNPEGTELVNTAFLMKHLCDLMPSVSAGDISDLATYGYSVSWKETSDGLFYEITIRSKYDEEE